MGHVLRHDELLGEVHFVAHDDHWRVRVLHLVDGLDPVADRLERFLVGLIETKDDAVSLPVELVSDIAELLLACRVPDFDRNSLVVFFVKVLRLDALNSDSLEMTGLKVAFVHSAQ